MSKTTDTALFANQSTVRVLLLLVAVATVFVASYAYAGAANGDGDALQIGSSDASGYGTGYATTAGGSSAAGGGEGSCACCGPTSTEVLEGATTVDGDVQRIDVDIALGYEPNVIYAKAGVPIEITFARGDGCFAEVYFPEFEVLEDLTQGPKTITLPALEPGEYGWSCGMQMVFGAIVVE